MAGLNKKDFKTVAIKGKNKGNIEVCNYNNNIIVNPKDKQSVINKKVADCMSSKPKEQNILVGTETLQAPDNEWMVIKDTQYYKVPDSQKGVLTSDSKNSVSRITKLRGNVVFVKYQGTLRKMIKTDKNAPYNYIDAATAIPYYEYILKNKSSYSNDPKSMELIAWAEGVDKKVKGTSSFDGNTEMDLSFDGNTTLDLSFDGNTNWDLSFDGDSGADGEYFYIAKPKTKVFAKDKKTGVIHNTKKKLGRGSKVKGKAMPESVHKFQVKDKQTGTVSTINKAAGFIIIGQNDLAQMLVPVSAIRPLNVSNFEGNTEMDLSFEGSDVMRKHFRKRPQLDVVPNGLDLGFDGNRAMLREMKVNLNHRIGFDGNTALDLGFDGNTDIDLSIEGGSVEGGAKKERRGKRKGGKGGARGERKRSGKGGEHRKGGKRKKQVSSFDGNTELDLSFNGGALEEDFHGGGDMLYFDGNEEMSNAFGDWVKKIKTKMAVKKAARREKRALSKEQAAVLANENKVVFTEEEMRTIYDNSGSTKPFNEWTKGEGAKNFLNSVVQFGAKFLEAKSKQVTGETGEGDATTESVVEESLGGERQGEKLIMGMHPVNFTIAAVVVGALAIGGIYLLTRGNKAVAAPIPVPVG